MKDDVPSLLWQIRKLMQDLSDDELVEVILFEFTGNDTGRLTIKECAAFQACAGIERYMRICEKEER